MAARVSFYASGDLLERIQAHRERSRQASGLISVTTSAVIASLIVAALDAVDARSAGEEQADGS